MKIFKEITLEPILTPQTFYLDASAEVLDLINADDKITILMLTPQVEAINKTVLRTFKICLPDETLYNDAVKYIGSFNALSGRRYVIEILGEDKVI